MTGTCLMTPYLSIDLDLLIIGSCCKRIGTTLLFDLLPLNSKSLWSCPMSHVFCLGTEVPRCSAGSDYGGTYVSRARAMMHNDAYHSTKDKQTGSGSQSLRDNSSADASWLSLPTIKPIITCRKLTSDRLKCQRESHGEGESQN